MNLKSIRESYPITRDDIFLNHAATTPIAKSSIERIQQVAAEMRRPLSEHFYHWLNVLEDTRRRLAEFIHVHPTEIAFCQNTSTGLSLIANAIPFKPGDHILVPRNEFPSNIYVWQNLQKKGIIFNFFDIEAGVPVVETLQKLDLNHVRLISISAVSYLTGRQYDLKAIVDFCHEHQILICYDAIQALGAIPFDVQVIQPDFIASGAQKWLLGSVGVGFIYAQKAWLEKLTVPLVGWTSVKYPEDFSLKAVDFSTDMTRFEPGLPDILPIVALNQTLRDLTAIGWDTIYARVKANTGYLTEALQEHGIETLAKNDHTAGIVAFSIPDHFDAETIQSKIKQHNIHITQRDNYIRVSPHFYNTQEEMDVFLSTLKIKSQHAYIVENPEIIQVAYHPTILLTGATGILGKAFAQMLAKAGYPLTLVARDSEKLNSLTRMLQEDNKLTVKIEIVNFDDEIDFKHFLQRLKSSHEKYYAIINCVGVAEADEFIHLPVEKFRTMLQINCVATFQLMQLFVTELKAENALGILNIVSASGRCGWPLLSGYAASHAALWSLGEVLSRELSHDNKIIITTYVAPPMHSRMQKRLGRVALRYFKFHGDFPYQQAAHVAREAWKIFNEKKSLYVNRHNRLTLFINALFPSLVNRKIQKMWKK